MNILLNKEIEIKNLISQSGKFSTDEFQKVIQDMKRREFGCVDLYRSDGTAYTSEGISTYKILWFAGNKNI